MHNQEGDQEKLQHEIMRFPIEVKKSLIKKGYKFYELFGKSIEEMKDSQIVFSMHDPDFYPIKSHLTEVAFIPHPLGKSMPDQLFIQESVGKHLEKQDVLFESFSQRIERDFPGAKALRGNLADYAELWIAHQAKTGDRLFDFNYRHRFARTSTYIGNDVAIIGTFTYGRLWALKWTIDQVQSEIERPIGTTPLIVPANLIA